MITVVNHRLRCLLLGFVVICIGILSGTPCLRAADDATAAPGKKSDNRIHITADRLVTDTQSQYAEFSGNVRVVRDDTVIQSDFLKIYYKESAGNDPQIDAGADSIRSIVAQGNVKIKFDQQLATTQKAEWMPENQTIVLSGPGSTIVSGKNTITGSKITVHQVDNRISVEGGSTGQVEAVFYSEEGGLEIPGAKDE